ncbi:uncharacterized protein [Ranitomeya imitator]|uniref:uncharacterized protein n=1 Tax=Ranitomeya imitator TaxID=111125 RepID=UPI0037E9516F
MKKQRRGENGDAATTPALSGAPADISKDAPRDRDGCRSCDTAEGGSRRRRGDDGDLMQAARHKKRSGGAAEFSQGTMLTSDESSVVAAALVFEAARLQEERRPKRKRRMWTRSWLQKRSTLSHMGLIRELRDNNPHDFRNYLRMSEESFKIILSAVTPLIQRSDTPMRAAVPVDERLAVTLRFLATGRSLQDLQFSAAVSRPFLSVVIPETCAAIVQSLRHYMEFPKSAEDWKKIASDFDQLWQFPNCGGALDGKHVRITQPANSAVERSTHAVHTAFHPPRPSGLHTSKQRCKAWYIQRSRKFQCPGPPSVQVRSEERKF